LVCNADRSVRYVNPAFEELTGFSRDQLMGRKPPFPWSGKDLGSQVAVGQGGSWSKQSVRCAGGKQRWVDVACGTAVPADPEGLSLEIWRPVGNREELPSELVDSRSLETLRGTTQYLAHEFNNLLQIILGYGEILLLDAQRDGSGSKELSQIVESAGRAIELTRNLRDLGCDPSLPVPRRAGKGEAPVLTAPRGREHILLVDDEAGVRNLCRRILEQYGYQVLTAKDGETALAVYQVRQSSIDLVILDLVMPGMGGLQCLRELTELDPDAKVVVATGFTPDPAETAEIERKAGGLISKPYEIRQILEVVRKVLDRDQGHNS
jgi:CheY-like chemotaxis protein